jgi:hypothetical protein
MQRSIVNYKTVKENSDCKIDADYHKLIKELSTRHSRQFLK